MGRVAGAGQRRRWLNALAAVALMAASMAACSDDEVAVPLFDDSPELFEVPSVVGKTVQFAAGVLSTIGSPAIVEVVDGLDGVSGTVVEQLPRAGTLVTLGSPVVLKVPGSDAPAAEWLGIEEDPDGGSAPTTTSAMASDAPATTTTSAMASDAPATTTTDPSSSAPVAEATTTSAPPSTATSTMAPVTVAPSTTVFPVSDVTVLTSGFAWGETGARVRLLQQVLGVDVDGVYGPGTRSRHLSVLVSRGLSTGGVPGLPATTTVAPTTTTTTTTVAPATTTTTSTTTTVAPATTTSTTSTTTTVAPATTTTTTTTTTTSTTTTTTTTTTTLAPTNGATAVSSSVAGHLPVRSNSQWTFIPADRRSLTVSVATTDFSSRIKVYDPNVVLLRTSVASGEKNSSVLLLSGDLCVDGEYTIVVESRIDYHSGNFTLTLTPGTELWDLAKPSC